MINCFYEGLLHLLVILTNWVIVLSMSALWQGLVGLFSNSFFTALAGAVTGGFFTLWGARQQANRQRAMDEEKQERQEQNKLKYLFFLIEDIHTTINTYSQSVTDFTDSLSRNPYVIPDIRSHHSYSLEAVASKLNQEEYYLSALTRLDNPDFVEIFRMINALETIYSKSVAHCKSQFPLLIDDKIAFGEGAKDLPEILMSFLNGTYNVTRNSEKDIYDGFVALFSTYPEKSDPGRLVQIEHLFLRLEERFKDETFEGGRHWKLISEIIDKNKRYRSRMSHVANAFVENQHAMNRIIGLMHPHVNVLKVYVASLPYQQTS